jgi:hypothetical protein
LLDKLEQIQSKEEVPLVDPNKKVERTGPTSIKWSIFIGGKSKKPKEVSVHWLLNGLLKEVEEYGLSRESKIYDIENLGSTNFGVVRKGSMFVVQEIENVVQHMSIE